MKLCCSILDLFCVGGFLSTCWHLDTGSLLLYFQWWCSIGKNVQVNENKCKFCKFAVALACCVAHVPRPALTCVTDLLKLQNVQSEFVKVSWTDCSPFMIRNVIVMYIFCCHNILQTFEHFRFCNSSCFWLWKHCKPLNFVSVLPTG